MHWLGQSLSLVLFPLTFKAGAPDRWHWALGLRTADSAPLRVLNRCDWSILHPSSLTTARLNLNPNDIYI